MKGSFRFISRSPSLKPTFPHYQWRSFSIQTKSSIPIGRPLEKTIDDELLISQSKTITSISTSYLERNQFIEATKLVEEAYHTNLKKVGVKHLSTITLMETLSQLFASQRKYDQAHDILSKLFIAKQDASNRDKVHVLRQIAEVYAQEGKIADVRRLNLQIYKILTESFDITKNIDSLLGAIYTLASSYLGKDSVEAEKWFTEGMKWSSSGGDHSEERIYALNNFAEFKSYAGEPKLAINYYEESLVLAKKSGNKELLAEIYHKLSLMYLEIVQPVQALELESKSIELWLEISPKEYHLNLARSMMNYAALHSKLGNETEAENFFKKGLTYAESLGQLNYVSMISLKMMTDYIISEKYVEAEACGEKAVFASLHYYGELHDNTITSKKYLGQVYRALGKSEKARNVLNEALESSKLHFGENHPTTQGINNDLRSLRK